MKITVLGLWHLGCVTAACCAEHFPTTGLDFDDAVLSNLKQGKAPVAEPGLDDLLSSGLQSSQLRYTSDIPSACSDADVLWVCYDTPVNADDEADVEFVMERMRRCIPSLPSSAIVILSSQMPVGTCRKLVAEFPHLKVACAPENLRLGKALPIFRQPDRIILGVPDEETRAKLETLFGMWSQNLIWMRPESAEMTKHGINSFLALSITFMNELARMCELTGADAAEVERGLKSESRIGPGAYLRAGGAFAGGTLARDVVTLTRLAEERQESLVLIPSIKVSNDRHKAWAVAKLHRELGSLHGRTIAVLGLTYKSGTDTLRRSLAVEICAALVQEGAIVKTYDPALTTHPEEVGSATLEKDIESAIQGAEAAIICTEWPEIRQAPWPSLVEKMQLPLILDANGFIGAVPGVRCLRVGAPD